MKLLSDETRRWIPPIMVIGLVCAMAPVVLGGAPAARGTPTAMAVASPRATPVATPAASPVAPGCGNEASSPTEVAEVFVAAATAMDLGRAALCFAPDRQPASWDDVFLGSPPDDVRACRGVSYTVTESKIASDFSAIIFVFDRACVIASLDDWQQDLYDTETRSVTTLVAQVSRSDARWYVQDAFASVPD